MMQALIQRFVEVYPGNEAYYLAIKDGKTKITPGGIKETYGYKKQPQKLNAQDYEKHIKGEIYLTLVPIKEDETCNWGAIDVDSYDNSYIDEIVIKAAKTPLVPVYSSSGGLHLYLHSEVFIKANLMRKTLRCLVAKLGLPKNTEIFPKQDNLDSGKGVGNGIKLTCHKVDEKKLLKHLDLINAKAQPLDYFCSFKESAEPEKQHKEDESKVDTNDLKEIIKNIKNKKVHNRGGDVDNHIVDFVSVAVGLNNTDKQILKKLSVITNEIMLGRNAQKHGNFENYIKTRIKNFRKKYAIKDPEIYKEEFLNNIIYLMDSNTYLDKTKNKIYKEAAIKIAFSKELNVQDAVKFFKDSRNRILCESYKYRPQQYNPINPVITVDNLQYVNKYKLYNLEPEQGDVSLFLNLLKHVVPDEEVRESLLDFICYHYQYPGIKIKFAWIVQTDGFQIGKGSIWYAIKNTLGDSNTKKVDIEEALDKAKQFLTDKQLVLIDEMKSDGDWDEREKVLNKFKLFITEEEHSSRRLYLDYETIKDSCTNFMFFTNYKDAIVLPLNETRYAVYHSPAVRLDDEYYQTYYDWVESDKGKKALLYFFKSRKIRDTFKPKGIAPKIGSLKEMSLAGEKTLEQQLRSLYDQMLPPFEEDRRIISSTWLGMWCKSKNIKIPRPNDLAKFLQKISAIDKGQISIHYNKKTFRPTLWIIRHHDLVRDLSEKQIGNEFLDRYIDDKLIYEIYMFAEAEIEKDYS